MGFYIPGQRVKILAFYNQPLLIPYHFRMAWETMIFKKKGCNKETVWFAQSENVYF